MSTSEWISPVKIEDSTLLGCEFSIDDAREYDLKNLSIHVGLNFDHREKETLMVCRSILDVTLICEAVKAEDEESTKKETDSDADPMRIGCKIGMIISIDSECFEDPSNSEQNQTYLEANAVSMGFGKVRAFIEALSTQSPLGELIVPAISPYDLIRMAKEGSEEDA